MAGLLPRLVPIEHAWHQLKRQMPLCHSARLNQDYKRRLINTMPDRVVACIAEEGGPVRH